MSKLTANEVKTQGHIRTFLQVGGPSPDNEVMYAGLDTSYLWIESPTNPKVGGISPINMHDPYKQKSFRRVSRSVSAPEFPTATVQFSQKHGAMPMQLIGFDCPNNFYQAFGSGCEDLTDFINGWDYLKIFSYGEETTATEGGGSQDTDDAVLDGLAFTFANIYPMGKLQFGEELAAQITLEAVDVVYGSYFNCGNCGGREDDGTQSVYALVAEGAAAGYVAYQVGNTVGTSLITPAAITDEVVAIDIVGRYLVVVYKDVAGGGMFVSEINQLTGVPGAWTNVIAGFVTGFEPNDIYVANPREVYLCGDAGYVYKSTNVLQGVEVINAGDTTADDLFRIHGVDETVYAGGETGTVIYTLNRGESWAATTTDPSANAVAGLDVRSDNSVWVVDALGGVFHTKNRGELAWNAISLPAGATIASGQDIVFVTDEVGYILAATAGPAGLIYMTWDGGENWSGSPAPSGRLLNYPVIDRGNRLAVPRIDNLGQAANHVAVAGLAGNGTDGVLLMAEANVI